MLRNLLFATVLSVAAFSAHSQVVVQELGVSTDTINVFKKSSEPEKSGLLAMVGSIVLPGLGQQYLEQNNRALAYYSVEALFIFGAFFCNHYSNQILNDAKVFAWDHANVIGGAGANNQFWADVGIYDESDGLNQSISRGHNKYMELAYRNQDKDYLTENLQWRWDDTENRKKYSALLDKSKAYNVASSFFLGAMVLDRLVSFIDARVSAQKAATSVVSSVHIVPQYDPFHGSSGASLHAEF